MTKTENSCEPYSRPASPSWPSATKFTSGILLLIVLLLVKLIVDYGDNIIISWGNILFLILYTTILCLIFIIVNQNYFIPFSPTESSYLSPLFRVRSRLTFLPITHFIRQQNVLEKKKANDDICDEQSNPVEITELSTRIEEQRDILIDEILQGYVFPWYNRISDEETFPSHFKNVLQSVCTRFNEKLRQVDRTTLAKEAIQLIHCHWKEYCDVVSRADTTDENVTKHFKLSHVFVEQKSELSRYYEKLVCLILRELVIPDLQSNLLCQFLSGILVKCFVMYYVDMISQPKWINTSLVCFISSGGLEMTQSSQNCPLPETPMSTCSSSIFASEDSVIKITSSSPVSDDRPIQLYDKGLLDNGKSTPSPQPSVDFFNDDLQIHSRNITPSDDSSFNEAPNTNPDETSLEDSQRVYEFSLRIQTKPIEVEDIHLRADALGKNIENNKTESDTITDGNRPERNNLIDKKEETTIIESKPEEKNSCPTNQTNGKKIVKEKVKLAKSNPLFGSVSSALSGLLTTAALPLLPEGCHGSLENLSSQGHGANSPLKTEFSSAVTTPKELTANDEPKRRLSADAQKDYQVNENNLGYAEWKDQTAAGKVNSRHYSFDESAKAKNNYNLETKSLDESKSQVILRQQEFDYGIKDNEKLTTDQSDKASISPMYEEPEDFAATIAKLRSLLEQRESKKNLLGSDAESDVPPDLPKANSPEPSTQTPKNTPVLVKGRPSLNSQSSASSLGSDGSGSSFMQLNTEIDKMEKIVDELEDPEPLQCLFTNVMVSRAESLNDSSDQYTLYCIQYEGVYPEEDDEGHLGKIVLRTTTVKRRFKEFLLLQSQLEENKIFKPHLKGIKAPNKWLNLSFSKVDSAVLNQRKTLLEKYLQQLCYHPILGFCHELRQFMAYGEEGFNAFCLSDGGTNVPRFDKLAKKFTGVINTLRDALPTFDSDSLSVPSSPDGGWKTPGDSKGSKLFSSFLQFGEKMQPEEIKTIITASTPESKGTENIAQKWIKESGESGHTEEESEDKQENSIFSEALCDELADPLPEETNASIYPLAAAVTQLLCDVLWLPDHRPHTASVGAFMSISGKSLENYVQETLDMFLSEEAFLRYLELFTSTMKSWNDSNEIIDEQTGYYTELDLKNCLKKKIPVWVRWMWGRHRLDMTIERMAGFCQNSVLNHDLILSLLELIFSKIVDKKEILVDNLNHKES